MTDYKRSLEILAKECEGACSHCSLNPKDSWCVAVRDMDLCRSMRVEEAIRISQKGYENAS